MASICSLPVEVIALIVKNFKRQDLYACTVTNKYLYKMTMPYLWRVPTLTDRETVEKFLNGLSAAANNTQWIQKLTLHNDLWTDTQLLLLMAHDLSQVQELRLIFTRRLTEASLVLLPERCPNIKLLRLCSVPGATDAFITAVGQRCHQLTTFDFSYCDKLGSSTYAALQACPLRTMYIASPPPLLKEDMALWDLVLYYPSLTALKVCIPSDDELFIPRLLSAAVSAWPGLTTLALHGYLAINNNGGDDDALVDFLRYHPGLTHLYLRQSYLSGPTLRALAAIHMPYLKELAIIQIKSAGLCPDAIRQLIGHWPQLDFIFCHGCEITAKMFPEVGVQCTNYNHSHFYLNHLDREDIHEIRLGGSGSGSGGNYLD